MTIRLTLRRLIWLLWLTAAILFALAFFLFYFSSKTYLLTLPLNEGETVTARIFRPLPYRALNTELWFARHAQESRPELGTWSPNTMGNRHIRFENPGEAVLLEISTGGKTIRREALPAYGYGQAVITRELIAVRTDDDPQTFHRQQCTPHCLDSFTAGIHTLRVKVLSVGGPLRGEKVQLALQPPLGFKTAENSPAYAWLWLMYFYPLYLGILLLWLLLLLAWPQRRQPSETD